ncbi:hypothetical protein G6549_27165, partial [Bacillus sp. MM2020_1]|nr:hypothetical protein [Bacillus sp. MM2020_1]
LKALKEKKEAAEAQVAEVQAAQAAEVQAAQAAEVQAAQAVVAQAATEAAKNLALKDQKVKSININDRYFYKYRFFCQSIGTYT